MSIDLLTFAFAALCTSRVKTPLSDTTSREQRLQSECEQWRAVSERRQAECRRAEEEVVAVKAQTRYAEFVCCDNYRLQN